MVDMTRDEYEAVKNKVVIGVAGNGDIIGMETFGLNITAEELAKAVDLAVQIKDKASMGVALAVKKFKEKAKVVAVDIN